MDIFKYSIFGINAVVLGSAIFALPAQAHLLCSREADFIAVNPSPTFADDACVGSVTLQGIAYQCGPRSDVESKRAQFLEDLKTRGAEFCKDFCAERGWFWNKCHGHFSPPQDCGFTVPSEISEIYGREQATCDPACGGVAFTYCSIYKSGMLQVDPKLLSNVVPNCTCRRD